MDVVEIVRNMARPEAQARVLRTLARELAIFQELWEGTEPGDLLRGISCEELLALAGRLQPLRAVPPHEDRCRRAFHLAGHAVAALLAGAEVEGLSLDGVEQEDLDHPLPGFSPQVRQDLERAGNAREDLLQRRIMILMAGAVAQELAGWDPGAGTEVDEEAVIHAAMEMTSELDAQGALQTWLRASLRRRLGEPATWERVERLAGALQEHGRLTRAEVLAVLKPARVDGAAAPCSPERDP